MNWIDYWKVPGENAESTTSAGESEMRAHLMNVEDVIENEIKLGATQKSVAMTYALALVSDWPTDWSRVNRAILARWPKGLKRIKEMAWSGKAFSGVTPGSQR